ncbi:MAG: hypothetical protein K8T10_10060 [Candidatus Eremiobacteraeota bacterium]|nr:hypothetical protein [Candidatus Eremiobacteraeota bacterium]
MNKTFSPMLLIVFLVLLISGGLCQAEDMQFKSNEYANNKIGLRVIAPPGWTLYPIAQVQSRVRSLQESEIIRLKGKLKELEDKKDSDDYRKLKQALDNLEESVKNMQKLKSLTGDHNLSLFQALKTVNNSQIFVKCRAISTDIMPQAKTGKDYLSIYMRSYGLSGSNPILKKQNIGGKVVYYVEVKGSGTLGKGMKDIYRIYCTVVNKYFLVMTCSFPRGEESGLNEFLRGINFK